MRRFALSSIPNQIMGVILGLAALLSCERIPSPDFSFLPRENVEAGDTIWFTNLSKDSYDFEWDFGDGSSTQVSDPKHVYQLPGIYETTLTATNESGEGFVSYSIFVNDPTVLGFIVSDSTGNQKLGEAEVWIYTSAAELDKHADPLYLGICNVEGIVDFLNVEPRIYHIWIIKQEGEGYWAYKGITSTLKQNRVNRFTVPCVWFDSP